jgi:hypothetical protein
MVGEAWLPCASIEAERAMAERKQGDEAFRSNFERLKAERVAREAREKS